MSCKFFHEREGCIGCGACANIDPVNWEMNEDGKADLKDSKEIGKGQEKDFDEKDLDKNMEICILKWEFLNRKTENLYLK